MPFLKWANWDINVAEWANNPKFSALDDIVAPLRFLELFFDDDVLDDMIFRHTKLYSHREKANISFEITNKRKCLFLSILMISRCHKFPDHKMCFCISKV